MLLKQCLILVVLAVGLHAKNIRIRNMYSDPILLSHQANDQAAEQTVSIPGTPVVLNLPDDWAGRIWADWNKCGNEDKNSCNLPITVIEFTWDPTTTGLDFYDISLLSGFNMVVKVVPIGNVGSCEAVSCQANLLRMCPEENVVNVNGTQVGCLPSPDVFAKYCSQAFATIDDAVDKVMTCSSKSVESFEVSFG